ncbi:hypothetical protein BJX63DRAFT_400184 [Aspergillus granulosus]|uniref:Uncharacterized protein n=1 Tax=Aspergillus granulosus TaxID=176169 RepID=A0ABR4H870_9EURO
MLWKANEWISTRAIPFPLTWKVSAWRKCPLRLGALLYHHTASEVWGAGINKVIGKQSTNGH